MNKSPKEERFTAIVCRGLEHLYDHLEYTQISVLNKLNMLGHTVSVASLSKIKTGKLVGLSTLSLVAKGMESILEQELDMAFDDGAQDFRLRYTPNWRPTVIPQEPEQHTAPFTLHDEGRVSVKQKTDFIADAKKEVIEVGIRLNSFSSYFISQNESAYKTHILALLRKGVAIKAYLLDPDCNEARIYFEDRSRVQSSEKESIAEIKKVVERLKVLCAEFEAMQLQGKFEIYLYRHIPYSLYLVVDGGTEDGKMMVSPYLYGVSRANCPVMEFAKKDRRPLYRRHWESVQLFMSGAHKLC